MNQQMQPLPLEAIECRRRALAMVGAIADGKPPWAWALDDLKEYTPADKPEAVIDFNAYRLEGIKAQAAAQIAYWAMQKVELATRQSIPDQIAEYGRWLNQIPIEEEQ